MKQRRNNKNHFLVLEFWNKEQNSTGYFWSEVIKEMHNVDLDPIVIHPKSKSVNSANKTSFWYRKKSSRIFLKIFISCKLALKVLRIVRKKDTVVCGTNPEFLLLILAVLKFFLRFRMLVLVHDIFPENTIPAQVLQKKSYLYFILKHLFSWAYRTPEDVVVIGRDMKKFILEKKNRLNNIHYIPCWVDHHLIVPEDRNKSSILTKLGLQQKIVFLFFGNFGRLQGIQNLLNGIELVKHPSASFLFVGAGVFSNTVRDYCSHCSKEKVVYLNNIDSASQSEILAACDVSLVSLAAGMYGLAVPSKVYFSMAADRPCLAVVDKKSEIGFMIEESEIGWRCDPDDPIGFAKTVDQICASYPFKLRKSPRKILLNDYANRESLARFVSKLS